MSDTSRAVFLSYASQDAEAARRICEALRAAGVEVWFDQSELSAFAKLRRDKRGGAAWDQEIRRPIKECALFVPVISANTQARTEGYFRRERKLAVERTHDMVDHVAFLVPVVIDATKEHEAHVPDKFREVQWTRLPGGEGSTAFCARVKKLLGGEEVARAFQPVGADDTGWKARPTPPAPGKSIAVLAFADLSHDPENEYFSDGISEEQLIDPVEDSHLWSGTFDRERKDIFAVQDEIAGLIAQNLQLTLGRAARKATPVDPEAFRRCLEGRRGLQFMSENGDAHVAAGLAAATLGRIAEARAAYERGIELGASAESLGSCIHSGMPAFRSCCTAGSTTDFLCWPTPRSSTWVSP